MRLLVRMMLFWTGLLLSTAAPAQIDTDLEKANKQYELSAFSLAARNYEKVLRNAPRNKQALSRLADCYRYLNEMRNAADRYQRAIDLGDLEPVHYLNYGKVLKGLARYSEAQRWFRVYAQTDPAVGEHYAKTCDFARGQLRADPGFFVENEPINSRASDFGPAFYGNNQLVFSSSRIDIQRYSANWNGEANDQLFVAERGPEGSLRNPYFLRNDTEDVYNQGPVAFSPDGSMVVFTKNNFVNGIRHIPYEGLQLQLYMADVNANGDWINIRPFPYNGEGFSTGFPSFSPDGEALYFASDRPDVNQIGGFDVYRSRRSGSSWMRPENLGSIINTPGNELTPYFDGDMLFFASDWHPGLGGMDIFRAEQLDGRWTQVYHLGAPVSSPRDDYGLIYDSFQNIGYFVSNRMEGKGNEDIYYGYRVAENIILEVRNAADGEPVNNAVVDFTDCGRGVFRTDERGIYPFQAVEGMNCTITVRKEGYLDEQVDISSSGQRGQRRVTVSLAERGEVYYGKILDYQNRRPLENVQVIATNQNTGNRIRETTDSNGDYQLALSSDTRYVLRYSRRGYRDINRTVTTGQGNNRNLLGAITMNASDAPFEGEVPDPGPPVFEDGEEGDSGNPEIPAGYAIQVAALSRSPDMANYRELEQFGRLYSKKEGSSYKVRVGVFSSEGEAKRVLRRIKDSGYSSAYVRRESGTTVDKGGGSSFASEDYGAYKVQLGAYRNTAYFDGAAVRDLGRIEDRQKGNLTIKLLAGFQNLQQAENARRRAERAGFEGAFIVMENERGQLVRVRE